MQHTRSLFSGSSWPLAGALTRPSTTMQLTAGLAKQTVAAGKAGGVLRRAHLALPSVLLSVAHIALIWLRESRSAPPMASLQAGPAPPPPPAAAQPPPQRHTSAVRWLQPQAGPPRRPAAVR